MAFVKKTLCAMLFIISPVIIHAAERPNIILCMADDMGWGDPNHRSISVVFPDGTPHPDQGWIQTPTLDAMMNNGLRFDRFYSASAVCSPTRASCLTGRNPFRVGVPGANSGKLRFDETPLSEVLSAEGYATGHFGKWHLGTLTTLRNDSNRGSPGNTVYSAPWHHGYDYCFVTEAKVPTYHPYRQVINGASLPSSFEDPNFYGTYYWRMPTTWNYNSGEGQVVPVDEVNNIENGDDSKLLVDETIAFIQDAVDQNKPFFVVLWFHTPHKPLVDPDGISGKDSSDALRDAIEDLDTALGRLRSELTTLGVRGNTMLWFTSDNGAENGANSFNETDTVRSIRTGRHLERKRSLYEGGVRVPGLLEWPDVITTNRSTDFPVVTSDYYTTILDYLGISVPNQKPLDGISLRPVIEGTATVRSKPIGFKHQIKKSWMNQQYKLIHDGFGWKLYDLINIAPGEEIEETPVATAANIGSQPQEIQDVYNTMLAEFTAWQNTVGNDTPYIHSSQPTVVLTNTWSEFGSFTVTATFSEAVSHLNSNEFYVVNGTAGELTGSNNVWTLTVVPMSNGLVTVQLPEGAAIDAEGNINGESNLLSVEYRHAPPHVIVAQTNLSVAGFQTVDAAGNVPANQGNNINDFSNPFATTLYVRSNDSDPERRVRALVRFDLTNIVGSVTSASLGFYAYSLNVTNDANLEVVPLAAVWSDSGSPAPAFDHPTIGSVTDDGSIISGLDSTNGRTYTFDITEAAQNWQDGTWTNHGLLLMLNDTNINNGVGIQLSGNEAIHLEVESESILSVDTVGMSGTNDVSICWNSIPGATYRVETTSDLSTNNWNLVAVVSGDPGATTFLDLGGANGSSKRFYRIVYVPSP